MLVFNHRLKVSAVVLAILASLVLHSKTVVLLLFLSHPVLVLILIDLPSKSITSTFKLELLELAHKTEVKLVLVLMFLLPVLLRVLNKVMNTGMQSIPMVFLWKTFFNHS